LRWCVASMLVANRSGIVAHTNDSSIRLLFGKSNCYAQIDTQKTSVHTISRFRYDDKEANVIIEVDMEFTAKACPRSLMFSPDTCLTNQPLKMFLMYNATSRNIMDRWRSRRS
jgi:hypothetical protein